VELRFANEPQSNATLDRLEPVQRTNGSSFIFEGGK